MSEDVADHAETSAREQHDLADAWITWITEVNTFADWETPVVTGTVR